MLAKEIMTAPAITIKETAKIYELSKLLTETKVSGVPVCDDDGQVVGFVSEADLLGLIKGNLVKDIMSRTIISVQENATLEEVAAIMRDHRIKRVPVFTGDTLIGIISRADIVAAIAGP